VGPKIGVNAAVSGSTAPDIHVSSTLRGFFGGFSGRIFDLSA
jgi:hypothetical protein